MTAFRKAGKSFFSSDQHLLYRELAWLYDGVYARIFSYNEQFERVDRILREHRCHKILEVGCGTGRLMELLETSGYEVVGLDLSKEMLKIARKRVKGRLIGQDMRRISLRERFDAVVCLGRTFAYMIADMDVVNALRSFSQALKQGGTLIFDSFNASQIDEGHFEEWKKNEFNFETFEVTRLSKGFDYNEKNNSWVVRWRWIVKGPTEKKRIVQDRARLRAFSESYLRQKLKEEGSDTLETIDEDSSIVLIAQKCSEK